ncbi:MAG: hypothetical protein LBS06_02280, partial [Treponema sp.]|nr:hypothetical protein [Treponema sp.]
MTGKSSLWMGALLFSALLLFVTGACENFMIDSEDNSFKKGVEETVWNATAPVLNIQVHAASPSEGITSPNGRYSVKQKIPFLVQFTVESAYFGFVRWMAYDAETMQPFGPEVVEFADSASVETEVTVHAAVGNILIQPLCSDRPAIQMTVPNNSNIGSNAAFKNQPFVVKFNKPIDRSSFQFPDGSWEKMEGSVKQFMNISFSTPAGVSLNHLFNAPTFDNDRTVRFSLASQFSPNTDVVVVINREVHDSAGVTMGNNYMVEYFVGANFDTSIPYLEFLALADPAGEPLFINLEGLGGDLDFSVPGTVKDKVSDPAALEKVALRRYKDTVPLALIGADPLDGQYINGYRIYARQAYDAAGNSVMGPQYQPIDMIPRLNDTTHALVTKCRDGSFSGIDDDDLITYVEYDISSSTYFQNGVIELEITIYDQNGLVSDKYLIYVIKDTTAPALSGLGTFTPYSTLHFDNAAGRWFNGSNSSLELRSSQTNPSASDSYGYPPAGIPGVPRPHSGTVRWHFRLGASGTPTSWEDWAWAPDSPPYTAYPLAGSFGVSGSYDVYAQLRDDLGNESGWQKVTTINIDTAAPVISAIADADIVR